MASQDFPRGWDEERVKQLIEHYESITEEQQVAEDGKVLERQEDRDVRSDRDFLELIERSRAQVRAERGISSEEMRARFHR